MKNWQFFLLCCVVLSLGSTTSHAIACLVFALIALIATVTEK